jgi:hypothetical protein
MINLYYGAHQVFGAPAHAQRWVNILGRVDATAPDTYSLHYALNGGQRRLLRIGPDRRRLGRVGDFNIEIDRAELRPGENRVEITLARDWALVATQTVTIENTSEAVWRLPYRIDWAAHNTPQTACQVVDGNWRITPEGLRCVMPDYDRIVAIGNVDTLRDCEVRMPLTVNAIHEEGWVNPNSTAPGLGIVHRWTGHTDRPVLGAQPSCGFLPSGAQGWYDWGDNAGALFLMDSNYRFMQRASETWKLHTGITYIWRMRLETRDDGCHYALNVWPAGAPEPDAWMLRGIDAERDPVINPPAGSVLIVAHHIDVTVGAVEMHPI